MGIHTAETKNQKRTTNGPQSPRLLASKPGAKNSAHHHQEPAVTRTSNVDGRAHVLLHHHGVCDRTFAAPAPRSRSGGHLQASCKSGDAEIRQIFDGRRELVVAGRGLTGTPSRADGRGVVSFWAAVHMTHAVHGMRQRHMLLVLSLEILVVWRASGVS